MPIRICELSEVLADSCRHFIIFLMTFVFSYSILYNQPFFVAFKKFT